MARERVLKKSFQQSLEDIKERMKEKRTKRLASVSIPSRGRSRMISRTTGDNNRYTILKGVQANNKALAIALQAEKEKVRQANAVILQLKREQQAIFLHLLLLKRKLKEQEALEANALDSNPTNILVQENLQDSPRKKRISQALEQAVTYDTSTAYKDPQVPNKYEQHDFEQQFILPPTVGVRRQHADRQSRRRSEHVRERRSLSEVEPVLPLEAVADVPAGLETLTASPIYSDSRKHKQTQQEGGSELTDPTGSGEFQHSTPEHVPPKAVKQQPSRKQTQLQPHTKPEVTVQKSERGRKPDRAPLKKPWENPKPRARSKRRNKSATQTKTAPLLQGNKLNTSVGCNDTFDFDCEESVHLTPFRAKAEETQAAESVCEVAPQRSPTPTEPQLVLSKEDDSSLCSPSSESEGSIYVPQRARRRQSSPEKAKVITTRRSRLSTVTRRKENVPSKQEITVFRDEASPKSVEPEKEVRVLKSTNCVAESPDPVRLGQENHNEMAMDGLLPVSPLVEAEMMRIDNVLSNFENSSSNAPPHLPRQTACMVKTGNKRGLGVRTAGRGLSLCDVTNLSPAAYRRFPSTGSRPSDARCSTPIPARKRRCTTMVDYKEPSLNAKLRRGDKFTDLQFLRSPIFKQKSGRRSAQKSRESMKSQQSFEKFNESFVGCC
ncbi:shugoshin 1 [Thalassophryne amazonica]|uniref:shugoshin 1 n=1 Tax=Thalassophryne amazonica TaxID=390379 RepID=UPI0014708AD7|nr:shugoshin 1 [Thalassophryne amazonica]